MGTVLRYLSLSHSGHLPPSPGLPLQHPKQLLPVLWLIKYLHRTTSETKQGTLFALNLAQPPSGLLREAKQLTETQPGQVWDHLSEKREKVSQNKWTGFFFFFVLMWDVWLSIVKLIVDLLWSCSLYREQLSKLSLALKYFHLPIRD